MKWETREHTLECPVDVEVTTGEGDDAKTETVHLEKVIISTPKGRKMREIMRLVSRVDADPLNYPEGDMTMDSIQAMSDMPPGGIDELYPRDITILRDTVAPFFEVVMGGGVCSETSQDGSAKTKPK